MAGRARRSRRITFWTLIGISGLIVAAALFTLAVNVLVVRSAGPFIVSDPSAAPSASVAIVLGAGVYADGTPSPMLADRLDAALLLYREGKVKSLLLSGTSRPGDDETTVMRRYLVARGVPAQDLLSDPAGFHTYASMLRAHNVFSVKSALIPTQGFHVARAVYLARHLGIGATGVSLASAHYSTRLATVREWPARAKAFLQVYF